MINRNDNYSALFAPPDCSPLRASRQVNWLLSENGKKQMKHLILSITISTVMFLSACADTHYLKRTQGIGMESNLSSSVYIALPKDGSYEST